MGDEKQINQCLNHNRNHLRGENNQVHFAENSERERENSEEN